MPIHNSNLNTSNVNAQILFNSLKLNYSTMLPEQVNGILLWFLEISTPVERREALKEPFFQAFLVRDDSFFRSSDNLKDEYIDLISQIDISNFNLRNSGPELEEDIDLLVCYHTKVSKLLYINIPTVAPPLLKDPDFLIKLCTIESKLLILQKNHQNASLEGISLIIEINNFISESNITTNDSVDISANVKNNSNNNSNNNNNNNQTVTANNKKLNIELFIDINLLVAKLTDPTLSKANLIELVDAGLTDFLRRYSKKEINGQPVGSNLSEILVDKNITDENKVKILSVLLQDARIFKSFDFKGLEGIDNFRIMTFLLKQDNSYCYILLMHINAISPLELRMNIKAGMSLTYYLAGHPSDDANLLLSHLWKSNPHHIVDLKETHDKLGLEYILKNNDPDLLKDILERNSKFLKPSSKVKKVNVISQSVKKTINSSTDNQVQPIIPTPQISTPTIVLTPEQELVNIVKQLTHARLVFSVEKPQANSQTKNQNKTKTKSQQDEFVFKCTPGTTKEEINRGKEDIKKLTTLLKNNGIKIGKCTATEIVVDTKMNLLTALFLKNNKFAKSVSETFPELEGNNCNDVPDSLQTNPGSSLNKQTTNNNNPSSNQTPSGNNLNPQSQQTNKKTTIILETEEEKKNWITSLSKSICYAKEVVIEPVFIEDENTNEDQIKEFKLTINSDQIWTVRDPDGRHNASNLPQYEMSSQFIDKVVFSKIKHYLVNNGLAEVTQSSDPLCLIIKPCEKIVDLQELQRQIYFQIVDKRTQIKAPEEEKPLTNQSSTEIQKPTTVEKNTSETNANSNTDYTKLTKKLLNDLGFGPNSNEKPFHNLDATLRVIKNNRKWEFVWDFKAYPTIGEFPAEDFLLTVKDVIDTTAPGLITIHPIKDGVKIVIAGNPSDFALIETKAPVLHQIFTGQITKLVAQKPAECEEIVALPKKERDHALESEPKAEVPVTKDENIANTIRRSILTLDTVQRNNFCLHLKELLEIPPPNTEQSHPAHFNVYLLHALRLFQILSNSCHAINNNQENLFDYWRNFIRHAYETHMDDWQSFHSLLHASFQAMQSIDYKTPMPTNGNITFFMPVNELEKDVVTQLDVAIEPYKEKLKQKKLGKDKKAKQAKKSNQSKHEAMLVSLPSSNLPERWLRDAILMTHSLIGETNNDKPYKDIYIQIGHHGFGKHYQEFAEQVFNSLNAPMVNITKSQS